MADSMKNIISRMQQLQDNQDGTMKGGYISLSGNRPRIIVGGGDGGNTPEWVSNTNCTEDCSNKTNSGCTNKICHGSTNSLGKIQDCQNIWCDGIKAPNFGSVTI